MKRYRLTTFFVDGVGSMILENLPESVKKQEIQFIRDIYGDYNIEEKLKRVSKLDSPSISIIGEYSRHLMEIKDAYVMGYFYPALTGACCLGERIFNVLLLKLKNYYKNSEHYGKICRKSSFQKWNSAIRILTDWKVITKDLSNHFIKLEKIRHSSVHYQDIKDIEDVTLEAINEIHRIVEGLFSPREDIFFMTPGEFYVRKKMESNPFVREFILPNCHKVGYKNYICGKYPNWTLKDDFQYEEKEIIDEEFCKLRVEWRKQVCR